MLRNMPSRLVNHRMAGALAAGLLFLGVSLATRISLTLRTPEAFEAGAGGLLRAFGWGELYDLAAASVLIIPVVLYLTLLPQRLFETRFHAALSCAFFFLLGFALLFIAVGEWIFWGEFETRFNFIAVDYLIYTRELIGNVIESYPVPTLLAAVFAVNASVALAVLRTGTLATWHASRTPFPLRALTGAGLLAIPVAFHFTLNSRTLGDLDNQYLTDLGGNGPYSFVAAFRNNKLSYARFYRKVTDEEAFRRVRHLLAEYGTRFDAPDAMDLLRHVQRRGPELHLNVVQITVESLSAKYLGAFGNEDGLTPNLDALAGESLLFTNFFATGNRTVRGMEALTLGLPPTPGKSVVKRPDNGGLFSLGSIFRSRGYDTQFRYGGHGYFDNMNTFFRGNGYRIIDRNSVSRDDITFSNVWGAADEDLFRWSLREADRSYDAGKPFFQFVMTTSNHRPFTYPDGRIDIPSHEGRYGGIKYTDWAIGDYMRRVRSKPWFKDTVFVIVADPCAGTSGRVELPPRRYRIPLLIYAPGRIQPGVETRLSSQIDYAPRCSRCWAGATRPGLSDAMYCGCNRPTSGRWSRHSRASDT